MYLLYDDDYSVLSINPAYSGFPCFPIFLFSYFPIVLFCIFAAREKIVLYEFYIYNIYIKL